MRIEKQRIPIGMKVDEKASRACSPHCFTITIPIVWKNFPSDASANNISIYSSVCAWITCLGSNFVATLGKNAHFFFIQIYLLRHFFKYFPKMEKKTLGRLFSMDMIPQLFRTNRINLWSMESNFVVATSMMCWLSNQEIENKTKKRKKKWCLSLIWMRLKSILSFHLSFSLSIRNSFAIIYSINGHWACNFILKAFFSSYPSNSEVHMWIIQVVTSMIWL